MTRPQDRRIDGNSARQKRKKAQAMEQQISYADSAVVTWLRFLQMEEYAQDFLDNGYDDLETAKRIGSEDLDAIGVASAHHRAFLLDAVRVLREQGAVWVYLLQEEHRQQQQQQHHLPQHLQHQHHVDTEYDSCGERVSAGSSGIASGNSSSIPWNEAAASSHDRLSGSEGSSASSSSSTNAAMINKKTQQRKCQVELTPEHQRALNNGASVINGNSHMGTLYGTRLRLGHSASTGNNQNDDESEDLIQRVSDMQCGGGGEKSSRKNPWNSTRASLGIQLRERLDSEGVDLTAPSLNTKVGESSKYFLPSFLPSFFPLTSPLVDPTIPHC